MWDDLVRVERILGNPHIDLINRTDWPGLSDPALGIMAGVANGNHVSRRMCCTLRREILAYHEILTLLESHQEMLVSLQQSKEETLKMCQISSIDDLRSECDSNPVVIG